MRVLIVVPDQDRISGNWVSADRFADGLKKHSHQVAIHAVQLQGNELRQTVLDSGAEVAMLLHAYRSGKPWLEKVGDLNIPYVVLLTGTDINQGLGDPQQEGTILTVLRRAARVLLQNPLIATEFSARQPEFAAKLKLLPPGITLGSKPFDLHKMHDLPTQRTLFLCPAGLRPVKGVLELLQMFDGLIDASAAFHFAVCGPIMDAEYGRRVVAAVRERPWASYIGRIPTAAMASAMLGADVILNNSRAEGLANSLLEAATLGIPILARNIPGNAAVVRHAGNGLLYEDNVEFIRYARQLLDRDRRRQLSNPDPYSYNPEIEATELVRVLQQARKLSGSQAR